MSLLVTIFLLVFVTELISWIGKSVLLDIVRYVKVWATFRSDGSGRSMQRTYAYSIPRKQHVSVRLKLNC